MKIMLAIMIVFCLSGCASAFSNPLKGLVTLKAADTIKAADKMTGIEKMNNKVADKASLIDNSKASSTSVGGNQTNDSDVMKDYIQAIKEGNAKLIDVMWKIIGLLIAQLIGVISAFGGYLFFTIKAMLKAKDTADEKESAMLSNLVKEKNQ
jgi:hypothetical protein